MNFKTGLGVILSKESTDCIKGIGEKMTEGLKPCPFCGESPAFTDTCYSDNLDNKAFYIIACYECPVSPMILETSKEHAIKTWNTRVKKGDVHQKISEKGGHPLEDQLAVRLDEKRSQIYS